MTRGWHNEPGRHSLASKGIKTKLTTNEVSHQVKDIGDVWQRVQEVGGDSIHYKSKPTMEHMKVIVRPLPKSSDYDFNLKYWKGYLLKIADENLDLDKLKKKIEDRPQRYGHLEEIYNDLKENYRTNENKSKGVSKEKKIKRLKSDIDRLEDEYKMLASMADDPEAITGTDERQVYSKLNDKKAQLRELMRED